MSNSEHSTIQWTQEDDGIVVLTFDDPRHSANVMNAAHGESMKNTIARLAAERDQLKGVILTSAKKTFFAGGDLNHLKRVSPETRGEFRAWVRETKARLRQLETLGLPVVAAINGAALGGGLEIALAAHYRVIVDDPAAVVGFPEVTLGLLPGAGGVVRSVRMLGISEALAGCLLQGQRLRPAQAKDLGLVDQIVPTRGDLIPAAREWIAERAASGAPTGQPWDTDPKYKIPGGTPATPAFAAILPALPATLRKQLRGANYRAPLNIMAAAVEGAQVDFDSALEIEGRYFVELAAGQVAKNMIQAFFFDLQRVSGDRGRPDEPEPQKVQKAVVIGAGMMGAAIAYVCANSGIEVVLKDVSLEAAERGKQYSVNLVTKAVERGRLDREDGDTLLARIHPTGKASDATGADLVIEAVFEDPALKEQVLGEIEPYLASDALLASNTSTLPITALAESISRPEAFIGLHFFSPVDKMPLLEIVKGEQTADVTVWRALDLARQIRKTPIVVNDSRGFFTSRVIATFLNEGIGMVAEGVPAATIEQASSQAGYPAPVLQLCDELNLKLMRKIRVAAQEANEMVGGFDNQSAVMVTDMMLDKFDRPGRLDGRGFYEYENGKRVGLWKGLIDAFPPVASPSLLPLQDLTERMLFIESIEAVKCMDEGVIESVADTNIGSIMGIGFPGWTGGVLQYINGYDGGVAGFVSRARQLSAKYGERFDPPASLVERAEQNRPYADDALAMA